MATPEQTYRYTLFAMGGTALLIFAIFAGIAGANAWQKYRHTRDWNAVTATVEDHVTRCRVERKSDKNWITHVVTDCVQAAEIVRQKDGFLTPYRSLEIRHAVIGYEVAGRWIRREVPIHAFPGSGDAIGTAIRIQVDPSDSNAIDSPWSSDDMQTLWTMTLAGLAIGVLVVAVGWGVAAANLRFAHKRRAAAAALNRPAS